VAETGIPQGRERFQERPASGSPTATNPLPNPADFNTFNIRPRIVTTKKETFAPAPGSAHRQSVISAAAAVIDTSCNKWR
jgi:hypothetical protein